MDDTGKVNVASSDAEGLKKALEIIGNITAVPEIGKIYLGKVVRLAEFGAFVELFPGTDGLLHISEIAEHRVKEVKDELREGDQVMVKVLAIEGNRIKLSRKALIKEQKAKLAPAAAVETDELEISASATPAAPAAPGQKAPYRRATSSTSVSRNPTRAPSSSRAETISTTMRARSSTRKASRTSTALRAPRLQPARQPARAVLLPPAIAAAVAAGRVVLAAAAVRADSQRQDKQKQGPDSPSGPAIHSIRYAPLISLGLMRGAQGGRWKLRFFVHLHRGMLGVVHAQVSRDA